MKTSLEACEGQGSRAILPSPVSFDAVVHCKPEKRGGRAVSPTDYRETGAAQPPTPHQPAACGKRSRCHRRGKCGGSPGPSGEHKPTGLCSTLFTPNKDTEWQCLPEPGFPNFLSIAAPCRRLAACSLATCYGRPTVAEPCTGASCHLLREPVG